jgi:hypothetical protein
MRDSVRGCASPECDRKAPPDVTEFERVVVDVFFGLIKIAGVA